jgi:hypothetical protein
MVDQKEIGKIRVDVDALVVMRQSVLRRAGDQH